MFCLAAPGDGWSPRLEDAALHGCIPVIIMDNVHVVFETLLDWPAFSLRIAQKDMARLPQLLQAVTPARVAQMQANLARVWHRLRWAHHPLMHAETVKAVKHVLDTETRDEQLRRKAWSAAEEAAACEQKRSIAADAQAGSCGDGAAAKVLAAEGVGLQAWLQLQQGAGNTAQAARPMGQFDAQHVLSTEDDAFSTILQWLYSRIPSTR